MLELLYSVDGSPYLAWQAELLDASVRRVGLECRISRLTGTAPDQHEYRCLNRFWAIANEWAPSPEYDTVVILDPDMVFVRPLHGSATPNAIIGQPYPYIYDLAWCPLLLHRDHVRDWALTSLALARALYANGVGWIAEMWAGNIAAQLHNLQLRRRKLAVLNCEADLGDASVIHYCYDHGGFHKQRYRPGQPISSTVDTPVQRLLNKAITDHFGPDPFRTTSIAEAIG